MRLPAPCAAAFASPGSYRTASLNDKVGSRSIAAIHPVPPVTISQGLNATVMSYLDSVDFGFVVDRERIADPWELLGNVRASLDELLTTERADG